MAAISRKCKHCPILMKIDISGVIWRAEHDGTIKFSFPVIIFFHAVLMTAYRYAMVDRWAIQAPGSLLFIITLMDIYMILVAVHSIDYSSSKALWAPEEATNTPDEKIFKKSFPPQHVFLYARGTFKGCPIHFETFWRGSPYVATFCVESIVEGDANVK